MNDFYLYSDVVFVHLVLPYLSKLADKLSHVLLRSGSYSGRVVTSRFTIIIILS